MQALDGLDDHAVLKGLCGAFGVEADDLIIAEALKEPVGQAGENVLEVAQHYAQLAEAIDSAIYEAVRTQGIVKNEMFDYYSWTEAACYKSKALFTSRSKESAPAIPVAPAIGSVIHTFDFSNTNRSIGDIVGWFLMSEYAEDYCSNWHNFIAVLNQRKQLLSSMTEKVTIPLLKKALNDRVAWLEDIITLLKDKEKDFNAEQRMSDQEKDRRGKRNQEKLDIIRSLPAEKKTMISQPRTGQVSLVVRPRNSFHPYLVGNDSVESKYKKGDLICAHDKVGGVISTVTGVITDIGKEKPDVKIFCELEEVLVDQLGGFMRTHVFGIDISN
ncbi:hypothetical protein [Chromatium okenii]|uniref:hypothetical protein n=1 Tax=Chromatium okenii TaxID=61644 RepID=UPI0011B0B3FE|nr:hypothetical protein [Chromatium okenii]